MVFQALFKSHKSGPDANTTIRVEVLTSKLSVKIMDFPYFRLTPKFDKDGKMLQAILEESLWVKDFEFYKDSLPQLFRNSLKSNHGTVWFNIHDFQVGLTLRNLINRAFMYVPHCLSISPADKHVRVPQCPCCWRFSHSDDAHACSFHACYCPICNGPHTIQFHCTLASCYKGNPNAKPPVPSTPEGEACSHGPCCVNCGLDHCSDHKACPYWKS